MDVRCPRCSTEYELDETRVPEEGATVKCASCSFVFLVRKQAEPTETMKREWKVRQANGNLFVCHELTTLQRWIVEGKVTRDDDISLSGETWKRLGNIPELSSFFQVAEDAARGRAYEAMQTLVQLPLPPAAPPASAPPAAMPSLPRSSAPANKPPPPPPASLPEPPVTRAPAMSPPPAPRPPPAAAPTEPVEAPGIRETWKEPQFTIAVGDVSKDDTLPYHALNSSTSAAPDPRPDLRQINIPALKMKGGKATEPELLTTFDEVDDDAVMKAAGTTGSSKLLWLVALGLLLGAAVGYYFLFYVPDHEAIVTTVVDAGIPVADETVDAGPAVPANIISNPGSTAIADAGSAVNAGPATVDAGRPIVDAGTPTPDAGTVAIDAGVKAPAIPVTYDGLMRQADKLRDAEKPEAALSLYGRASDLEPNRIEPAAGRGLALLDMGQPNAALASFEQVLSHAPKYGPAVMGMAEAYRALRNNEKAIEWYQRYLDELPEGSEANVARNNIERLKQ